MNRQQQRILVLGAGAVGGYFGGRLLEKGCDVTFLVRPRRKKQLVEQGLVIRSIHGDYRSPVRAITAGEKAGPFDIVLLSVKAYHLEQALPTIRPYVSDQTWILPLLNGIVHLDRLKREFSPDRVLGGLCFIETTLTEQGEVEQYSRRHDLVFGELDRRETDRIRRLEELFRGARIQARASNDILREMWNKYIFISTFSGITSLMNSSIGPVLQSGYGTEITRRLLEEIVRVARGKEPSLHEGTADQTYSTIRHLEPTMKSSMLRDIEKNMPVEADHLHGALIRMAPEGVDLPLLKTVFSFLKTYESRLQSK
ncbi:ketopantoate reductase family protein [Paludifilum halophilum]|uniref:2-dehydropantoate 2-reductase n=1 Tax=Paludifilum halophilum TaxID=1642702 RepID=A0A235B681_9BACL|nr:ketopantoate reductase family protein [Paludifilum halophilum]OYD07489.1 2-dehydropantoate 2-reductase [Paludifilum halophilum]